MFRLAIVTLRADDRPHLLQGALPKVQVAPRPAIIEEKQLGRSGPTWRITMAGQPSRRLFSSLPHHDQAGRNPPHAESRGGLAGRMEDPGRTDEDASATRSTALTASSGRSRGGLGLSRATWYFPSIRSNLRPLSENAMNSALRRMGYTKTEVTAHGFRVRRSILNERGFDPDVIEAALAHQDENEVRRVYNRAEYWNQRVQCSSVVGQPSR